MPPKTHFDYIIIGNGLAGLQLAMAMAEDPFFCTKNIALIDKSKKNKNNKTWCFWEKGSGKWDAIVHKTWNQAQFYSSKQTCNLNLEPYTYKMLRSIDFYTYAKSKLSIKNNFHFFVDDVIKVEDDNLVTIITKNTVFTAKHVFDSIINSSFFNKKQNYTTVIQHFKGWMIETKNEVFNPDSFTIMDYRIKDGEQTTFTYVLPVSTKKALVEFTYFTLKIVDDKTYGAFLRQYLSEVLDLENYTILEIEKGNIPMTSFPFEKDSTPHITKIGTAGGWVKGSTGYSFKHTEKKVAKIIENLKQNINPSSGLINKKYRFYDSVFLKVLHDENNKGEWVFEQFYSKNQVKTMLKFLDEDTTLIEEFGVMNSLFSSAFIKAFFKTLLF